MTPKQTTIKNLKLLKAHWQKMDFDPSMKSFGGIDDYPQADLDLGKVNECGTSCCALGIAPSVKGLGILDSDFNKRGVFCYYKYSDRIVPSLRLFICDSLLYDSRWKFLFSEGWPDSRLEFLGRLEYMLTHDLESPEDFRYSDSFLDYLPNQN